MAWAVTGRATQLPRRRARSHEDKAETWIVACNKSDATSQPPKTEALRAHKEPGEERTTAAPSP